MQSPSTEFKEVCTRLEVVSWFERTRPTREWGRGPNRPKGRANGEPATKLEKFSEKAAAGGPHEKQKYEATVCRTLRQRHVAELCESDILQNSAKATKMEAKLHQHL